MKVSYKYQEPEIIIKPSAFGVFNYISENVKTNLIWLCLVRKLGNKYIIEDVYFPKQNVNQYYQCNFDEETLSKIMLSQFNCDYRPCRFNMIGRFTMSKTTEITEDAMKDFNKVIPFELEESLVMQLNDKKEISFGVNRRATLLTELFWKVDMNSFVDESTVEKALSNVVDKYVYSVVTKSSDNEESKVIELQKIQNDKVDKVNKPIRSMLLSKDVKWTDVL